MMMMMMMMMVVVTGCIPIVFREYQMNILLLVQQPLNHADHQPTTTTPIISHCVSSYERSVPTKLNEAGNYKLGPQVVKQRSMQDGKAALSAVRTIFVGDVDNAVGGVGEDDIDDVGGGVDTVISCLLAVVLLLCLCCQSNNQPTPFTSTNATGGHSLRSSRCCCCR
jgi:hypothetical protein